MVEAARRLVVRRVRGSRVVLLRRVRPSRRGASRLWTAPCRAMRSSMRLWCLFFAVGATAGRWATRSSLASWPAGSSVRVAGGAPACATRSSLASWPPGHRSLRSAERRPPEPGRHCRRRRCGRRGRRRRLPPVRRSWSRRRSKKRCAESEKPEGRAARRDRLGHRNPPSAWERGCARATPPSPQPGRSRNETLVGEGARPALRLQ